MPRSRRRSLTSPSVSPDLSAFNSSRVCALEVLTPYSPSRAGEIGKILGAKWKEADEAERKVRSL